MSNEKDIQQEFARFAGREFPLKGAPELDETSGKQIMTYRITNRDDATLNEMVDEAQKLGLRMSFTIARVGGYSYGESDKGAVVAEVTKNADGKFYIGNSFTLKP